MRTLLLAAFALSATPCLADGIQLKFNCKPLAQGGAGITFDTEGTNTIKMGNVEYIAGQELGIRYTQLHAFTVVSIGDGDGKLHLSGSEDVASPASIEVRLSNTNYESIAGNAVVTVKLADGTSTNYTENCEIGLGN